MSVNLNQTSWNDLFYEMRRSLGQKFADRVQQVVNWQLADVEREAYDAGFRDGERDGYLRGIASMYDNLTKDSNGN